VPLHSFEAALEEDLLHFSTGFRVWVMRVRDWRESALVSIPLRSFTDGTYTRFEARVIGRELGLRLDWILVANDSIARECLAQP
jgi:hypothetical protein